MFEIIQQFFDKKSPIFIITISILISTIILLGYDIDQQFSSSKKLQIFQKVVLIASSSEVVFKTIGMEIFRRTCPTSIGKIHVTLVLIFLIINIILYACSILLNRDFMRQGATSINEPHQFFLQIYVLVFTAVYVTILGLLISLKLQNQTMTVLQDQKNHKNGRQQANNDSL